MLKKLVAIGALAILMAGPAAAAEGGFFQDPKIRFGIGVNRVNLESDAIDFDAYGTGWSVFGGYEFNPYLAVEAGFLDGGDASDTIGGLEIEADTQAWQASVLGSYPLGDVFSVYARAGLLSWESSVTGAVDKVDGTDPYFGAGAAVEVEGALLRLEYNVADLDEDEVTIIQLSLVWRFKL